jgi:2-(S-pantetheinyl)-carbapenam-3-carboxylate methyltransferase
MIDRPVDIGLVSLGGLDWQRRGRGRRAATGGSSFAFLPYAAGLLEAYVRRHARDPHRYQFRLPLFRRGPVERLAAHLDGVDVAGFSTYCWNVELSVAIARELKRRSPRTRVIFGGPHVPDAGVPFLDAHPFIDAVVHGEGEAAFLDWLEAPDEARDTIPGITTRTLEGRLVTTPRAPRRRDLDTIPSPYLEGVFDRVIDAHPDIRWQALWETNRGCPFACTFCDWGSATASKVYQFSMDRLHEEIRWMAAHRVEMLFCCDANFGLLPRDIEIAQEIAAVRARTSYPALVTVQSTKNATERAYTIQRLLGGASPNGVTLSLQSADTTTLAAIKRDNISLDSFQELQHRYTRDGIETYTDLILGLAGETYASFRDGVSRVIANGQYHRIHFWNCSLLPNAEMAQPAYRAAHGLVTVRSRYVAAHQPIARPDGLVDEYLELVVATSAMPADDWVHAKAFWWMTDLLHCDRVLQIALAVLHAEHGLDFGRMIERFLDADATRFPTIAGVARLFHDKARAIQQGDVEFIPSEEWLGIYWPADEYALIDLVARFGIDVFYDEARTLLRALVADARPGASLDLVDAAVRLNAALLKVPFEIDDLDLSLCFDVWECYRDVISGRPRRPRLGATQYRITRTQPIWLSAESWCEDVLGRHTHKQTFLYPVVALTD